MNKRIYLILSLLWLLPVATMADGVVQGTVTLNNQTIAAEYYLSGATARLGSGYNSCISQYSSGKVVVPASITVNSTTYPVTEVSTYAFRMCSHITEVVIPEGVTRIGDFAFASCPSLQKATLPSTLTTIGAGAFIDLPSLQDVLVYAVVPPVWEYNDVFCFHNGGIGDSQSYHTNQVTLHVPIGSMNTYRHAYYTDASLGWITPDGWGYFNNIVYLPTDANVFFAEGNWNDAVKWTAGEVPALGDDIWVIANVTIPDNYTAEANAIGFDNGAVITIADGGQLHINTDVAVVAEKQVNAVTDWEDGREGWHLIASPLEGTTGYTAAAPNRVDNLVVDNYNGITDNEYHFDFYRWDGNCELQWRNYRCADPEFAMNNGEGYLYASRENRCLAFSGIAKANDEDEVFAPVFSEDGGLEAFSLYGNPFVCDAYLAREEGATLAFFVMNEQGSGFVVSEGPVSPMQGFFVYSTTADESFTVSRNAPAARSNSLCLSLMQGPTRLDNVMLRFGKGNMLPKMSFRGECSKVYIPVDGHDFAVVKAEAMGEMPVSFKAAKDGEYTLHFATEDMSFGYLHLIDNLTGDDIDLLAQPDYDFNAKTDDYASRFKLVFVANGASTSTRADGSENFAFYSNGQVIVGNEGDAVLQMVDLSGRVIISERISGSRAITVDAVPGVYMLRLIKGENLSVQKLIVQ